MSPTGRRFWLAWGMLAAIAVLLSLAAHAGGPLADDREITRALQSIELPALGGVLHAENWVGSPTPSFIITVVAVLALLAARLPRPALLVAAGSVLRPCADLLKALVDRPRPVPTLVHVTEHASGFSFPSGHVFGAVMLYGSLAVVAGALPLPHPTRRALQGLCMVVMLLMGPARVYVGAHWPSDVLGGYLWAALLLALLVSAASTLGLRPPYGGRVPR